MTIPVSREPTECSVCDLTFDGLDTLLTAVRGFMLEHGRGDQTEAESHILAAVCTWWVTQSLAHTGYPASLLTCFANALRDAGVDAREMVVQVPADETLKVH